MRETGRICKGQNCSAVLPRPSMMHDCFDSRRDRKTTALATDFFDRQQAARRQTTWLRVAFFVAIALVVSTITLIAIAALGGQPFTIIQQAPLLFPIIATIVLVPILTAAWRKRRELRQGGSVVAESLGGVLVTADERDPRQRQLRNIVEEMALASGITLPSIYVLADEDGINALAAGHDVNDAAVIVTAGALRRFNRDELQAVIAHEFSHILNGDMALNMRFCAWLAGLTAITEKARRMSSDGGVQNIVRRLRLLPFTVSAWIVGSLGELIGRALQAAVSRRREHLADASAVQFTRNPQALKAAFLVMLGTDSGTEMQSEQTRGFAHMFFASAHAPRIPLTRRLFATHPPLNERLRLLEPGLTDHQIRAMARETAKRVRSVDLSASTAGDTTGAAREALQKVVGVAVAAGTAAQTPATAAATTSPRASAPSAAAALLAQLTAGPTLSVGNPVLNRLPRESQRLIETLAADVRSSGDSVLGLTVAMLLDTDAAARRSQLAGLVKPLGMPVVRQIGLLLPRIDATPRHAWIPLVMALLPALEALDAAQRAPLLALSRVFGKRAGSREPLRFMLARMLEIRLAHGIPTGDVDGSPQVTLRQRDAAIGILLRFAVLFSTFSSMRATERGYRTGLMNLLPPQSWPAFTTTPPSAEEIEKALSELRQLRRPGRRAVMDGLKRAMADDAELGESTGFDVLQFAAIALDVPVGSVPERLHFADVPGERESRAG